MLPAGAAAAVWDGSYAAKLYDDEAASIVRAVKSRREEFARGRACARKALAQLGVPPQSIPVGEFRQPIWPQGFVGSITHCAGLVASVAALREHVVALGLDAERLGVLPEETRAEILHASEMSQIVPELETVVFSAKESLHKALFPLHGVRMEFLDVELALDTERGSFTARPAGEARRSEMPLAQLHGRFAILGGYVLTLSYLTPG